MANPSDKKLYLVAEGTPGLTPAAPVFQYFPYSPGDSITFVADVATSSVNLPGRNAAGATKTAYRAEGSIQNDFSRSTVTDLLLASAHSGSWISNSLTASDVDSSFTIEQSVKEGAVTNYRRATGLQVNKMSITATAGSGTVAASYELIGMGATHTTSVFNGATYSPSVLPILLSGADITNVSIGGLTGVQYTKLEYNVEHSRSAQYIFGSTAAGGIGTEGSRTSTLALSIMRKNWDAETAFTTSNSIVTATVDFGAGANGYRLTFKGNVALPEDEEEGGSMFAKMTLTAAGDASIVWSRLT